MVLERRKAGFGRRPARAVGVAARLLTVHKENALDISRYMCLHVLSLVDKTVEGTDLRRRKGDEQSQERE
jgi:hypothetical protein